MYAGRNRPSKKEEEELLWNVCQQDKKDCASLSSHNQNHHEAAVPELTARSFEDTERALSVI